MGKKTCKNCGTEFDPADRVDGNTQPEGLHRASLARTVFCSKSCKQQHDNKEYYKKNKKSIIKRILRNQRGE